MAYKSAEEYNHALWLGYVQPVGLVVSATALVDAGAHLDTNYLPRHQMFLAALPHAQDFPRFASAFFEWPPEAIAGGEAFDLHLPEFAETLSASFAVRDPYADGQPTLLLAKQLDHGVPFDKVPVSSATREWQATPQAKFERLLRESGIPAGLLLNGDSVRLVYAPRGESSGHITFHFSDMEQVAGRPLASALYMLLSAERLFSLPEKERLPAILANSRKFQNQVSTQLSGQILAALYELLRGFQSAHAQSGSTLLSGALAHDPNHIYQGLLTVLLRLVFLLFAEDRGLLSADPLYTNYYSLGGLFERLRRDHSLYPDTMGARYGGWAQLLTLFRLIYAGGGHGAFHIPARRGYLFDPDRYPFLEGAVKGGATVDADAGSEGVPRVSDGILFRVLSNLLVLDGERLSYRNLDVEQIGSVYEAVMGFSLEIARGPSVAILSPKKQKGGAPVTINLEELLREPPAKRAAWLKKETGQAVAAKAAEPLKIASTVAALEAALDRRIDRDVTPNVVPKGALIFQPSEERRRSGSHYTPRSLTHPIVTAALEPVLAALGPEPTPEQIVELKVCDPALGSGAFLVEVCRQLGDALLAAWRRTGTLPELPPDEDELLMARRTVAQRCLYGVDKNEMAADLAKLSLWLATLAKDHPFTFLNHAIRHGDAMLGLELDQIAAADWQLKGMRRFEEAHMRERIDQALRFRKGILDAQDFTPYEMLEERLLRSDEALRELRIAGDLPIEAFFSSKEGKRRRERLAELTALMQPDLEAANYLANAMQLEDALAAMRRRIKPLVSFHWPLEFPEVFSRENPGFDAIVGNPPFAGKNTLLAANAEGYLDWLQVLHKETHGNADLAAHFFRRAFHLLRKDGCFGLIATNTIAQGDTRSSGLRYLCLHGGTIYRARKRMKWPGNAAVVVSVVHVQKGLHPGPYLLDGKPVETITAYLFHRGGHEDPATLASNAGQSFQGSIILGMGFTFDDTDKKGVASPIARMHELIAQDPRNAERIFPYIGGEEINDSPTHAHHRYVINFEDFPLEREHVQVPDFNLPVAADWQDLLNIVRERVKPERDRQKRDALRERWWQYAEKRPGLTTALRSRTRAIARSLTSTQFSFTFVPSTLIHDQTLIVFTSATNQDFTCLSSRCHECWARFFGATFKDDPRYNVRDCFETFPFPLAYETNPALEQTGKTYYEFRADLMIRNNEGLTKTYNRFHRPDEQSPDIVRLRELHHAMDRAVLDAYEWHDIQPVCEFFPEFEESEEDEAESSRSRKRKYRYRWPDDIHDEVLARLLLLNGERAAEETLAKGSAKKPSPTASRKPHAKKSTEPSPQTTFTL